MRARPHFNPFNVREPAELPDWRRIFPNKNPLDLEIGCAAGRWLLGYAQLFPKRNIVGVEIRSKYVQGLKQKIDKQSIKNAYVLKANINTALTQLFPEQKLSKIFVMFPDPWYKKKHFKRRVITSAFLQDLSQKMTTTGELHIATDQQGLAQEMLFDIQNSLLFENIYGPNNFASENISGLQTDIEIYNLNLGKPIYRLVFRKK